MRFGDVVTAVATAAVILELLMFSLNIILIPALGFYWGINVGAIVATLVTAIIVGYIFAGKIWESRMEAITKITVLSAVLIMFSVAMTTAATDYTAVVKEAYQGESHTAFEWYVLECMTLSKQALLNMVIVLVLGFIGLYVGSMLRRPVKSGE